MNRPTLLLVVLCLGVCRLWANDELVLPKVSPLERAIESLASDSFREREAASKALWEFGAEAVGALELATKSPDPEVAYRARILWDRIRTGVGPDTPLKVVELVQEYAQGGPHEKRRVLEALTGHNAFPQILRLYHFEEDPDARRVCLEIVNDSVLPAVRTALAGENEDEAIVLLRMAPETDENFRRLAALYRDTGRIDEVLANLREEAEFSDRPLLLACLRAQGLVDEAIEVAREMEREDLVGSLKTLQGNPVPLVQWKIEERSTSSLERLHLEIVLEKWFGDVQEADRLARPMIEMAKGGDEDSMRALRSILLNGYLTEAIPIMEELHEATLFSYYDIMEQPWNALELMGYPREKPAQQKWRDEHLEFLLKEWDFHSVETVSLFSVAGLLYNRGAEKEAVNLLRPVMHAAREAGGDHWEDFIDFFAGRGRIFIEMGFVLLSEEILPETPEHEVKEYLMALIGRDETSGAIWRALGNKQGMSQKERFLAFAKVYGLIPGSVEEINELWNFLVECAEGKHESDLTYLMLFSPVSIREDTKLMLELLGILSESEKEERFDVGYAHYYSFHHRWQESEREWAKLMPDNGVGNLYLGSYAGVLWRLDRKEEAREILEKVTRKNLDDPSRLKGIALALEANGVWDLAAEYWRQILLTDEPTSRHWIYAVEKFNRDAKIRKDWALASSLAMVQNAMAISGETAENSPVLNLRKFFFTNFYKALDEMEEANEEHAVKRLEAGFSVLVGDGILADDFFPILRREGHVELHDAFFERAYARFSKAIEDFPKAHNSRNGAAWLASRAVRRLDEAERHVAKALELRPRQAAYLDTMAEVWFARHNREEAIKWSNRALKDSQAASHSQEGGAELRAQHDRFLTGELPVR